MYLFQCRHCRYLLTMSSLILILGCVHFILRDSQSFDQYQQGEWWGSFDQLDQNECMSVCYQSSNHQIGKVCYI